MPVIAKLKFPENIDELEPALGAIAIALREGTFGSAECFGSEWPLLIRVTAPSPNACRQEVLPCPALDALCRYILGMALLFRMYGALRIDFFWRVGYYSRLSPVHLLFGNSQTTPTHQVEFQQRLQPSAGFSLEYLQKMITSPEAAIRA